ncbi:hypothetical protein EOA32_17210 [Mesorhizobium sp. M1A.F.Ca.ET.072.01.1.1]|uniref:hypothetical protein n=1 Tax=Mesorhizobium sp. M1A.F.Ca.ET.072.01.1.1 TaxID=2496753 RepID=UPI000FD60F2F|nr:hypothetical protein [Mesorhizobium sp. M1A.F.Ca.ET.072.01.1.1]RUW51084.1 hypothetical protein EOA32_17210 [Mesorhizobium sp. M1A.F.Ca.ET.072.01.1.1]TIV04121.1 MAG: hypothetical protein E5W04_05085 [Mesorhizobium sp.]
MGSVRIAAFVVACTSLASCGTQVPRIEEMPYGQGEEQLLIQAIIQSVHCDLSNAVKEFIKADSEHPPRAAAWFENWGIQMALTLTIEEKTTINPGLKWKVPTPLVSALTLGASATGTATATRMDKSNYFYTVKELRTMDYCESGIQPARGLHSPLIRNDLRLGDFLFEQLSVSATRVGAYPDSEKGIFKQNVLQHQVKFEVLTAVGATPTVTLVRASFNDGGTTFDTRRDRTSDLLITMGPLDPAQKNPSLAPEAENAHLAQQIKTAVSAD